MIVTAVLLAGLLHAIWNSFVKSSQSGFLQICLIQVTSAIIALPFIFVVSPPASSSYPYLGASLVIHLAYWIILTSAYRYGDLSRVYPIARGSAPALCAIISWVIVGERLSDLSCLGVLFVSLGVFGIAFTKSKGAIRTKGIFYAVLTGITIACYTIADGLGARASESTHGYIAYLYVCEGLLCVVIALTYYRGKIRQYLIQNWRIGLFSGAIASIAYGVAIWATTYVKMAEVSALRETSILFAMIIGYVRLKERVSISQLCSGALVVLGVVLLSKQL